MTAVDIAERKGRLRAFGFLFIAAMTTLVMVLLKEGWNSDFDQGLWFGLLVGCALILLPIKPMIRPNNDVLKLLEDEGTREHRRLSCTVGFWAAVGTALTLVFACRFNRAIAPDEVGQIVATAAMVLAMATFAILELRAAR